MKPMNITELVQQQRDFFHTDTTKSVLFRKQSLRNLAKWIDRHEHDIYTALKSDLNKSSFESYMTEIGIVKNELRHTLEHLNEWTRPKRVPTPMVQFPAVSFIIPEPLGVTLIMAPWNYPFQLNVVPLIGAIAAGNCAILKPSAYAPHTAKLMEQMVSECFAEKHIAVVLGGREENTLLLEEKFDFIFFTGSTSVGKLVMEKAAKHVTPVCLEHGGKSPCIVDETANIALAAKRIVFGKLLNAGQTCVAPDYVYVHNTVKESLIYHMKQYLSDFLGSYPLDNQNYPKIINEKHFHRLMDLMDGQEIITGGVGNEHGQIAPTILDNVHPDSPVMQEEIFGPILPLLTYHDIEDVITSIRSRPKPLALYLFSNCKTTQKRILQSLSFGGGCINDTIMHLASHHLPFGGVGESGMGSYHGKQSFLTFSHQKSILKKSNRFDIPIRYAPYTSLKEILLKTFLK